MSSNIGQSILRVQRLCGNHALATHDEVLSFINNRHSDLLESFDWSRKKQEIGITARVDREDGTLALTNGSPTVNGNGTTFTASDRGRYLKIGADTSSLYVVNTVVTAQQITLGDLQGNPIAYPGASASGLNYVLFSRLYTLGAGIEQIVKIKAKNTLTEVSEEYLDDMDPERTYTASDPLQFARAARDMSGTNDLVRIEFYPRPSQTQIITATVLKGHVDLLPSQHPIVPSGPLEWFAAVDTSYKLAARTKDQIWFTLAEKYNGEAEKSLEREKSEDYHKFGLNQVVRDVSGEMPLSMTDMSITHDLGD